MRIDAHHHLWRLADRPGRWPPPDLAALHRDFGPDDLAPLLEDHVALGGPDGGRPVLRRSIGRQALASLMKAWVWSITNATARLCWVRVSGIHFRSCAAAEAAPTDRAFDKETT